MRHPVPPPATSTMWHSAPHGYYRGQRSEEYALMALLLSGGVFLLIVWIQSLVSGVFDWQTLLFSLSPLGMASLVAHTLINTPHTIWCYPEGIVVISHRETQRLEWSAFHAFHSSVRYHHGKILHITINSSSSTPIKWSGYLRKPAPTGSDSLRQLDLAAVYTFILQHSSDACTAWAKQAYDNGQTISFGACSISTAGVHYKKKTLPWADIQYFGSDPEGTVIGVQSHHQKRAWKVFSITEINNIDTFIRLITLTHPHLVTVLSTNQSPDRQEAEASTDGSTQ